MFYFQQTFVFTFDVSKQYRKQNFDIGCRSKRQLTEDEKKMKILKRNEEVCAFQTVKRSTMKWMEL